MDKRQMIRNEIKIKVASSKVDTLLQNTFQKYFEGKVISKYVNVTRKVLDDVANDIVDTLLESAYMVPSIHDWRGTLNESIFHNGEYFEIQIYYPAEFKVRVYSREVDFNKILQKLSREYIKVSGKNPPKSMLESLWIPIRDALSDILDIKIHGQGKFYDRMPVDRQNQIRGYAEDKVNFDAYGLPDDIWLDPMFKVNLIEKDKGVYVNASHKGIKVNVTLVLKVTKVKIV